MAVHPCCQSWWVKSFLPNDKDEPPAEGGGRNPEVDFRGERRRTRRTGPPLITTPGWPKGEGGKAMLWSPRFDGQSGGQAALAMLAAVPGAARITVGADRGYDTRGCDTP